MNCKRFVIIVVTIAASLAIGRAEDLIPPPSLAVVNAQLDGRIAIVKLSDGRVVKKARDVEIGTDWTRWMARGKAGRALTSEVVKVSLRGRRRTDIGVGLGLGIGLVGALGGGGTCVNNSGCYVDTEAAVATGGLFGLAVGALSGYLMRKPELELYKGPLDRFLAKHDQSSPPLHYAWELPGPGENSLLSSNAGSREQGVVKLSIQSPLRRSGSIQ